MRTEDLIQSLALDTRPVSPRALERRVAIGLGTGAAATLALMLPVMGVRADLGQAMMGPSFWMKWSYTISLAAIAVAAVMHVARPDAGRARWMWLFAAPVAVMLLLSLGELMTTPRAFWVPMWMGASWQECSMRVVALSVPVFIGLLWSFRRLAPSELRGAGAAAGLAAGACAATVYGLHCPEVSALFVVTWYSLGMAVAAGLGALLGPRLLRW